jgi:sRNA-binding regulator protein Hfq
MSNRKLIRPSLSEHKAQVLTKSVKKKQVPQERTNAELYYLLKQMTSKNPVVVVMNDGEIIRGIIEWYDKDALKINRTSQPNMMVYKNHIKYIYKDDEKNSGDRNATRDKSRPLVSPAGRKTANHGRKPPSS